MATINLTRDQASLIYDRLSFALEFEECFAHDAGEDGCEHCQIEKAMQVLIQGGLRNDRIASIEKDQAPE